jgi:hypothetical protein
VDGTFFAAGPLVRKVSFWRWSGNEDDGVGEDLAGVK